MLVYIITFLCNIANTVVQFLFCQILLQGGWATVWPTTSDFFLPVILIYHACNFIFLCYFKYFPFFLRQMLSLSCSHLFNTPIHRTVCPSPSDFHIVIKSLVELFISTVASTKINRSGPNNSRKHCRHM